MDSRWFAGQLVGADCVDWVGQGRRCSRGHQPDHGRGMGDSFGRQPSGPARIVSNSASASARNFMLGQGAYLSLPNDVFSARVRATGAVQGTPELFTSNGQGAAVLTHVVLTRDASATAPSMSTAHPQEPTSLPVTSRTGTQPTH